MFGNDENLGQLIKDAEKDARDVREALLIQLRRHWSDANAATLALAVQLLIQEPKSPLFQVIVKLQKAIRVTRELQAAVEAIGKKIRP